MSTLYKCEFGHVRSDCDSHDVVEREDAPDGQPTWEAMIEHACRDCGKSVEELDACELCRQSPADEGSDRCRACDERVAHEEAVDARATELNRALVSIAFAPWGSLP